MELVRVDTQRAYEQIRQQIIELALPPGAPIDEQALAAELDLGPTPVREALRLLAHDELVTVTPRHGLYVSTVGPDELAQFSELRLTLEGLAARLAAQRATADDLAVLDALCQALPQIPAEASDRLLEVDGRFHQAIAQAAHNRYLARTLDHYLGLSQRLWHLAQPQLSFLPAAVEEHLALVAAISAGEAEQAEKLMRGHVQDFYDRVRQILNQAP